MSRRLRRRVRRRIEEWELYERYRHVPDSVDEAARFLVKVKELIEDPAALLVEG